MLSYGKKLNVAQVKEITIRKDKKIVKQFPKQTILVINIFSSMFSKAFLLWFVKIWECQEIY